MFHEGVLGHYEALHPLVQRLVVITLAFLLSLLAALLARAIIIKGIEKERHIDATLTNFLKTIVTALAALFVLIVTLIAIGIPATALAGLLAAIGLVLGFALKDSLGNLAAGVILLINRPYNINEVISVKGHDGTVIDLGIAMTRIKTFDGRYVTIPNGAVMDDAILNWTRNPTRRVAVDVDVAYEDDLEGAIATALATAKNQPTALEDPAPDVIVTDLGDDGVTLTVRAWVNTPDFLATWSGLRLKLKQDLEAAGYTIPFPQRDVHMIPPQATT
jgi:small conductance mechanosensitive channel